MIKALDSSRQGMQVNLRRHEVTANNLANANTPGFRRELARVTAVERPTPMDPGQVTQLATHELVVEGAAHLGGGALNATGNPLDAALAGKGFFQVQSPEGPRLTRDGSFTLDSQGVLTHSSGYPVMVDGGSVQLSDIPSILPDGTILNGENPAGQLSIVGLGEGTQLFRDGENLFRAEGGTEVLEAGEVQVASGFLEGSNVDPIREMVNMIQAFRVYELNQKAAHAADETLQIAVNRVGSIR